MLVGSFSPALLRCCCRSRLGFAWFGAVSDIVTFGESDDPGDQQMERVSSFTSLGFQSCLEYVLRLCTHV